MTEDLTPTRRSIYEIAAEIAELRRMVEEKTRELRALQRKETEDLSSSGQHGDN